MLKSFTHKLFEKGKPCLSLSGQEVMNDQQMSLVREITIALHGQEIQERNGMSFTRT
jgi:hypothetical protein